MKLHGVFIGINKFIDPRINTLKFARADAESFYNTVESKFTPEDARLTLILDEYATKGNILDIVGEKIPRNVSHDDVTLIFIAGHGAPETDSDVDSVSRYLVTHDTKYDSIFATAIDMERDVPRLIERINASLVIVLLDTCFSGQAGGRTFEGMNLSRIRANWRSIVKFSELNLGEGRIILSACDSFEVAGEDASLGHGIFSYFLLEKLKEPSSDHWISIGSLYDEVAQKVKNYTNGRQNPVINGRMRSARLPRLNSN